MDLPVADEPLCTEYEETFRIGNDLTTVSSIGFDASGTVRIGDAAADGVFRVIAVSPNGDRFEFGRQGEGPGEFEVATRFVALANGHSVIPDYRRVIFNEFLPNGQFGRHVRMGDLSDALDMIYRADRTGGLLGQFRANRGRVEIRRFAKNCQCATARTAIALRRLASLPTHHRCLPASLPLPRTRLPRGRDCRNAER